MIHVHQSAFTVSPGMLSAFLIGLFGGVHCFSMCGGIVSALSFALPEKYRKRSHLLLYQLYYSLGRILTYVIIGGIAGILGFTLMRLVGASGIKILRTFAGLMLIALGLYLGGFWFGLRHLEKLGGVLWKKLAPLNQRLMPVDSFVKAISIGMLWGWLPCGLVYSTLALATTAGSWGKGMLVMFSFGLGTLPTLLITGSMTLYLSRFIQHPNTRRTAGILVILCGIWTLY